LESRGDHGLPTSSSASGSPCLMARTPLPDTRQGSRIGKALANCLLESGAVLGRASTTLDKSIRVGSTSMLSAPVQALRTRRECLSVRLRCRWMPRGPSYHNFISGSEPHRAAKGRSHCCPSPSVFIDMDQGLLSSTSQHRQTLPAPRPLCSTGRLTTYVSREHIPRCTTGAISPDWLTS
jgi:hypothetical protein